MNIKSIIIALVLFLIAAPTASAAIFSQEQFFSLEKDSIVSENIYTVAEQISLQGIVEGDIYGAGGSVYVSEQVIGDVVTVGGEIVILADVDGDVRVAGGSVILGGDVSGDILVAGGTVRILPDVVIGGDATIFGGDVSFEGVVGGNIEITGDTVSVNVQTNGYLHIKAGDRIVLGSSTFVGEEFVYRATNAAILEARDGVEILGATTFKLTKAHGGVGKENGALPWVFAGIVLLKALALIVIGLLAVFFIPRVSLLITQEAMTHPLRSFITGLLACIATPFIVILLFATLLGIPIALILMFTALVLFGVAGVYAGILFGAWFQKLIAESKRKKKMVLSWQTVFLGVILMVAIGFIPILGWAIVVGVYLIAVGSIGRLAYDALMEK